jgi:hypothetical protein
MEGKAPGLNEVLMISGVGDIDPGYSRIFFFSFTEWVCSNSEDLFLTRFLPTQDSKTHKGGLY